MEYEEKAGFSKEKIFSDSEFLELQAANLL
jgi:hypothetical protein